MTEEQWAAHVRMMVALMDVCSSSTSSLKVCCEEDAAWRIRSALITPEGTFEMVPDEFDKLFKE